MPLKIVRSPKARRDAFAIWDYVAADSTISADRLLRRIDGIVRMLADNPMAGAVTGLGEDIRRFPLGSYSVYYRETETTIFVVRILHAARDISPDLLSD